jgi:hypothetical protein
MQFFLPQNLATELIPYDPTLKKLARTTKSTSKSTKPKFPLGQPFDIIPPDVIKTSLVQDAVNLINGEPAINRVHEFQKIVGVLDEAKSITTAILYHYESCWYAAWLPPQGQEGDYIYGYAYAYKNTESAKNMIPYTIKRDVDKCSLVKHGRSEFITYQEVVTKEAIIAGNSDSNWAIPSFSWQKGENIREARNRFVNSLKSTIPMWNERSHAGIFQRLKDNNWSNMLDVERIIDKESAFTWLPSVDNLFAIIDNAVHDQDNYYFSEYRQFSAIRKIINKPFFRKLIQAKCEECIKRFSDADNQSRKYVIQPWEQIKVFLGSISYVHSIWPECPIDYYQTHVTELSRIYQQRRVGNAAGYWLEKNMPVASYFHILAKHLTDATSTFFDDTTGVSRIYFSDWHDTVSMIDTVLTAGKTIEVPKRWRITEFHDHVQAEAWKIKHTNQDLPQDLFPTPVKVRANEQTWTFIQPHDLHQLAAWGQAVRNCVGNASHYADDVKKKKHFIVLAMVDNKPLFTIQLEVNNGMMSVNQIKGVSNSSLTDSEKDAYTKAFGTALNKRNEELVLNPA